MTIRLPRKTWVDKILSLFGKEREFVVDGNSYKTYGPYIIVKAKWKSLIRTILGK